MVRSEVPLEAADRFLCDGSVRSLVGVRRSGCSTLIEFLAERAKLIGLECSVYPDTSGQVVFFPDGRELKREMDDLSAGHPGKDLIFGQEICHQYPAAVRYQGLDLTITCRSEEPDRTRTNGQPE